MKKAYFEWDPNKEVLNFKKHGVSFHEAQKAFFDPGRMIGEDINHSQHEKRYYCFGQVNQEIMTVRFTYRENRIRIIGTGYWREGRKIYEEAQSKIHKRINRKN